MTSEADVGLRPFTILAPTAILGYGFPEESFLEGLSYAPDCIAVDAGSIDPGPYYLGSGKSFTDRAGVRRDLRLILREAVHRRIPVIIGSAGGSGSRAHVAWCREIVQEIVQELGLSFRLGVIKSDIEPETVLQALREGRLTPLGGVPELTPERLRRTPRIVAQMGVEPIMDALEEGCNVILAGRAYDPAPFAAPAILRGYDPGPALHLGKILECAAIAAEPGSGADCALGRLYPDRFELVPLGCGRRFTETSVAAHTLYEKHDPAHLPGPGGSLDLSGASFEETGEGRVTVRGSRFVPAADHTLKLEGAMRVGFRTVCVAGARDPVFVARVDALVEEVVRAVRHFREAEGIPGKLHVHVYGRDGVMGPREPLRHLPGQPHPHEVGLVLDAVAETQAAANTLCSLARSTLLHLGFPGRLSTAGNLAFPFSPSDLPAGPVYEFSVHHLLHTGPRQPFALHIEDVGGPPA